jgi:hypothetical protein
VLGEQAVNVVGQNSGLTAGNQSHGEVTAIDQSPDHTRGDPGAPGPRDLGLRNPRPVRLSYSRISGKREWLIQSLAEYNAVLITGNRSSGPDSLEQVINEVSDETSLPVLKIADPRRVTRDPDYANLTALRLVGFLERIESLRGTGRLFIP